MTILASSLVASVFLTQLTPITVLATPVDRPEPAVAAVQEDAASTPDQPVVNRAAHLAHDAGRVWNPAIYVGSVFQQNLSEHNQSLLA